jgi:formylglycine-generating enzyme required for sulfatase activity
MILRLAAVLGIAGIVLAESTGVSTTPQGAATATPAPQKIDAKELALVERIRARIDERAAKNPTKPGSAYDVTIPNTIVKYRMAPIAAGEFAMGSSAPGAPKDEQPQHRVRLDAFWMQTHEVTWDAYLLFMFVDQAKEAANPDALVDAVSRPTAPYVEMSFGRGRQDFPAISMTQHAANKFAEWLSAKTGEYYRVPTEAEWEYACRAGAATPLDQSALAEYAWFAADSPTPQFPGGTYHTVATKKPNAWGLYDMLGNVMEWTLDQYAPYTAERQENPWVRATKPYPHAVRGGSWNDPAPKVTCTARVPSDLSWKKQDPQLPKSIWYMTDAQWVGFRLVRPVTLPSAEEMYRAWNSGVELDPY